MIPKIIHYCWFGGKPCPSYVKKCMDSWRKKCPDYEIKRWDESNFDVTSHPFIKAAYEEKAWAFVSDYARLKVIYDNGGIYLDTDVELLKNLDFLLVNRCYIGIQQIEHQCATGLGFGAIKFSPVVLKMLEQYDKIMFDSANVQELICPIFNTKAIQSFGRISLEEITYLGDVTVFPERYFDPIGRNDLLCADTVSIHHYDASWTSGIQKFKRNIARWIGTRNIAKIRGLVHIK